MPQKSPGPLPWSRFQITRGFLDKQKYGQMCISCLWTRLDRTQGDIICIKRANRRLYAQKDPKVTPKQVTEPRSREASRCLGGIAKRDQLVQKVRFGQSSQSDPKVTPTCLLSTQDCSFARSLGVTGPVLTSNKNVGKMCTSCL